MVISVECSISEKGEIQWLKNTTEENFATAKVLKYNASGSKKSLTGLVCVEMNCQNPKTCIKYGKG